jgi:hypothetical protein
MNFQSFTFLKQFQRRLEGKKKRLPFSGALWDSVGLCVLRVAWESLSTLRDSSFISSDTGQAKEIQKNLNYLFDSRRQRVGYLPTAFSASKTFA